MLLDMLEQHLRRVRIHFYQVPRLLIPVYILVPVGAEGRVDEDIIEHLPRRRQERGEEPCSTIRANIIGHDALHEFGSFVAVERDEAAIGKLRSAGWRRRRRRRARAFRGV